MSESEALRRLELQLTSAELNRTLSDRMPNEYGGMWLDQDAGGVLVIATTDTAKMDGAVRDVPDRAHVRTTQARWPLAQLTATRDRLDAALNDSKDPKVRAVEVVIDPQANAVNVLLRTNALTAGRSAKDSAAVRQAENRLLSTPSAKISAAIAAENGRAVVKQLVAGTPKTLASTTISKLDTPVGPGCDPRYCGPPMRGGMSLIVRRSQQAPVYPYSDYLNAWYGQCTNGFNITDNRGWNYVMTAGHCMVGPYKVGLSYTLYKNGTPVSSEVYNFENGPTCSGCSTYPRDYSIMPYRVLNGYNYYDYWLAPYTKNLVMSWCYWASSTWQGCADGSFAIRGQYNYNQILSGWIVCGTGSGDSASNNGYHSNIGYSPGTRCGSVTRLNGGIVTNICARQGDSGGPLFSEIDGRAYGILHGGYEGSGACPTNPPGTEWSDYSPISEILTHVRFQTLGLEDRDYGFRLRTS